MIWPEQKFGVFNYLKKGPVALNWGLVKFAALSLLPKTVEILFDQKQFFACLEMMRRIFKSYGCCFSIKKQNFSPQIFSIFFCSGQIESSKLCKKLNKLTSSFFSLLFYAKQQFNHNINSLRPMGQQKHHWPSKVLKYCMFFSPTLVLCSFITNSQWYWSLDKHQLS